MQFFFGSILSVVMGFVAWLVKKFGVKTTILSAQIIIYTAFIVFMTSFVVFTIAYLMQLWTTFKVLIEGMSDYSSVSGSYGGVDNSQIVSSTFALLHDSGLADALITSGTLFISLISLFLLFNYIN